MTWNQKVGAGSSARVAALAFMDGVLNGWYHVDFADWHARGLRASRRLQVERHRGPFHVHEPGIGTVELVEDFWQLPLRLRLDTTARLFLAMVSAHTRVLTALRGLVTSHRVDFVQKAYRAGRVVRHCQDSEWRATFRLEDALSDCVLGLFAADYLNHSEDYLNRLGVCRDCGRIRFGEGQRFRTLCDFHGSQWLANQRRLLLSRRGLAGGTSHPSSTIY